MTNMTGRSPKENALAVFDRFLTAFTAADIDAVVGVFWPETLFWARPGPISSRRPRQCGNTSNRSAT